MQRTKEERITIAKDIINGRTLKEVGDNLGVTPQTVSQIVISITHKAFFRLGYGYTDEQLNYEIKEFRKNKEFWIKILDEYKEYNEMTAIYDISGKDAERKLVDYLKLENMEISVRTYNTLKSKNINYLTDILYFSPNEIKSFSGIRIFREIMRLLEDFGFIQIPEKIITLN